MRSKVLLMPLLLCFFASGAFTEERPFFTTLGTREGLPNSAVAAIVQDGKGFLWFGTQGGLVRYDGYSYKIYENAPFQENGLSHNQVQTLFLDGDILWIGTYGGLNRLDLTTDRMTWYTYDPQSPTSLSGDLVISVERDVQGQLWVGTSKGLNRLDEKTGTFKRYMPEEGKLRSLPHELVRDIHKDKQGNLWIATSGGGLCRFVPETDDFERIPWNKDDPTALPSAFVMSIAEDADGGLWFGTWFGGLSRLADPAARRFETLRLEDDRIYFVKPMDAETIYIGSWGAGLFVYNRKTGDVSRYRHTDGPGSIPNDVVYSVLLDVNNVVWLGTNGGGVARSERRDLKYRMYMHDPDDPGSLPSGKMTSILEDRAGTLWVGVYNGGLNRLDPASGRFKHYRHDPKDPRSLGNDIVNFLFMDSKGDLWIGTNGGLSRYNRSTDDFETFRHDPADPDSIADTVVYSMEETPEGDLWVGTFTRGLDRYERATGRFIHFPADPLDDRSPQDSLVYALEYDAEGYLWLGYNVGLDRMKDGVFTRYRYDINNKQGISSNSIRNLYRDSRNRLWIGSVGGGLMRYVPEKDQFVHFTRQQGLPNNTVRSILESEDGDLWIGTSTGIGIIDKEGAFFRGYSVYNDLKDKDFHIGAWKAKDGSLYIGGMNTVYRLNPKDEQRTHRVPSMVVSDIRVNGKSLQAAQSPVQNPSYVESLDLTYGQNNFSVIFATVDYREPGRNLYSYKLEGFDRDWSMPSAEHNATYTNIPGGQYILRVRAADNEGYWNDTALTLPIHMNSPPWLTWPAFIAYFLILVGVGYLFALIRNRGRLKNQIDELTRLKSELEEANKRLDGLSMMDGLTGIPNRRRLDHLLPLLCAQSKRERTPLSVLMIDIDFFKGFNDTYGHLQGDEALKSVAQSISASLERATDFSARYGGEEFIVVLPNTDREGAFKVAERQRIAVQELGLRNAASTVYPTVTVSIGVATAVPEQPEGKDIVQEADEALYRAKSGGRNKVA